VLISNRTQALGWSYSGRRDRPLAKKLLV